jgi:histidinol-phosphate aminotransferase
MSLFSITALTRPELAELSAYLPDLASYRVRLDANEAPPLLSQSARARIGEVLADGAWERYPDPSLAQLRQAIAQSLGVTAAEILPGVGSDEVISLLLTAFVQPRVDGVTPTVLTTTPSFVMYRMSARCRGLRVLEVPLDASWDLSVDALKSAIAMSPPNIVFIASPNNPTSNLMSRERLEQVISAAREALVVVDEAYVAYSDCDQLDKVRLPYNVPTPTQRVAELAFTELAPEVARIAREVNAERARLVAGLSRLPGIGVTPSQANFLWLRTERPASELYEALKQRSILVRSFHNRGGRLSQQLRVTIGTAAENDEFLAALAELT